MGVLSVQVLLQPGQLGCLSDTIMPSAEVKRRMISLAPELVDTLHVTHGKYQIKILHNKGT